MLGDIAKLTGYHPRWLRTPEWAREAGVAQWDGDDPEPLAPSGDEALPPSSSDPRQDYLVALLGELSRLCGAHQIKCMLSPVMARCMAGGGALPANMDDYALWLEPGEQAKLLAVLRSRVPDGRCFEYMGNNPSIKDRAIRFHGLDSLYCRIDDGEPSELDTLSVKAVPLEPAAYPMLFGRALLQWEKGRRSTFRAVRAVDGVYSGLCGLAGDPSRSAARFFDLAMKHAEASFGRGGRMRSDGVDVDVSLLKEPGSLEYRGDVFAVPARLDEYCRLAPVAEVGCWLSLPEHFTAFAGHGFAHFVETGALAPDLFERRGALRQELASTKKASRLFRQNFREIKIAVEVKELALQLLPRKERIVELYESRDYGQLRSLLKDYLACADEHPKAGDMLSFDDEIYHIMRAVRQREEPRRHKLRKGLTS